MSVEKARDELSLHLIRQMAGAGRTGPFDVCAAIESLIRAIVDERLAVKPNETCANGDPHVVNHGVCIACGLTIPGK